ncbi:hypothetical protein [Pacificispira sp.]|uniref:hypothetical protein n=1 Tax=Pacificispira sp. TaxID=2888761 RepID=UPI003BAA5EB4
MMKILATGKRHPPHGTDLHQIAGSAVNEAVARLGSRFRAGNHTGRVGLRDGWINLKNGFAHADEGPAVRGPGDLRWYFDGYLDRIDGPAKVRLVNRGVENFELPDPTFECAPCQLRSLFGMGIQLDFAVQGYAITNAVEWIAANCRGKLRPLSADSFFTNKRDEMVWINDAYDMLDEQVGSAKWRDAANPHRAPDRNAA